MAEIKLSESGSKMLELYNQLQQLSDEVYNAKVNEIAGANDAARANRIFEEVYNAFDSAVVYVRKQILGDAEDYLMTAHK